MTSRLLLSLTGIIFCVAGYFCLHFLDLSKAVSFFVVGFIFSLASYIHKIME
jgi:uncharacterized membrane protein HdeD (DUF308 family)